MLLGGNPGAHHPALSVIESVPGNPHGGLGRQVTLFVTLRVQALRG
jgi:hypothetical protein